MELFDQIWDAITHFGMPIVQCYHLMTGNIFLNTASEEAVGFERVANVALVPFQYVFAGKQISSEDGVSFQVQQHFDYSKNIGVKTIFAISMLPLSITTGTLLKAASYLFPEVRQRHARLKTFLNQPKNALHADYYRSIGLEINEFLEGEVLTSQGHVRPDGAENIMAREKEALKEIVKILSAANIPFWVDCGTCLGTYRYGGVIPWDTDIDLAILQPDFENVLHLLQGLDQNKYVVQDWSSRDKPGTYLKVYIRENGSIIDIYHFKIDLENKTVASILSNEDSVFLPESWKIRERRFKVTTPFEVVFPLKKGVFDGIEVPVPNKTKKYLQLRYGENIDPIRIYNPVTGHYDKDLTHPYWLKPYVH